MNQQEQITPTNTGSSSGLYTRIAVTAVGVVVFGLLLFADKTNLTNETRPAMGGERVNGASKGNNNMGAASALPPLAADATTDGLLGRLQATSGAQKATVLDSLIIALDARNRPDHAAGYAGELADMTPTSDTRLRAGLLYQKAYRLPHISQDTVAFRAFSDKAIGYLQMVTEAEPTNEQALLALGTALVESRSMKYPPMMGIQTLKKVLEINPKNIAAILQLGMFSLQSGQFDKAVGRFEEVLRLAPKDYTAMYGLAVAKSNLGDRTGAIKLLDAVLANTKDPDLKAQAAQLKTSMP